MKAFYKDGGDHEQKGRERNLAGDHEVPAPEAMVSGTHSVSRL
jgi:hypothetical protein